MKLSKLNEIFIYFSIIIIIISLLSLPALINNRPNFSEEQDLDIDWFDFEPSQPSIPGGKANNTDTIGKIMYTLLIIAGLVIIINLIYLAYKNKTSNSNSLKKISKKEAEIKLKDARTKAYAILRAALENGDYTGAYVEAYQTLDADLGYFNELSRPKYWTPKEYSMGIQEPIYRPSVYIIVRKFYLLRYASRYAERDDIISFIEALDNLFINDTSEMIRQQYQIIFDELDDIVYSIPRIGDKTRPRSL